MKIIADSREQKPLVFPIEYDVTIKGLKTGDYSLVGFEDRIAVERKSINDLVCCLTSGRNRFRKQLARLSKISYRCVMIETTVFQVARKRYVGYIPPDEVLDSVADLMVEFKIPFLWTDNPQLTARSCLSFLRASLKRCEKAV